MSDLLTQKEHDLIIKLGECACDFAAILGDDNHLVGIDSREFTDKIHQLQHTLMAQAAARAFPGMYRLLGESPIGLLDALTEEDSE